MTTRWGVPVRVALVLAGAGAFWGCDVSAECLPWFKGPACLQQDLGRECSADSTTVARVTVKEGSNDVVSDPGFENCDYFLCASTNASRPYCTRKCETQLDCNPLPVPCLPGAPCPMEDWRCEVLIEFGALACKQIDPATNGCETDPETGKVLDPVKYCRAVDGSLPKAQETNLQQGTDGGP